MSSNGQVASQPNGTSAVATPEGKVVQVPDLNVPTNRIYNFVAQYRKEYFEDHSLDWCLDEIITRGIAEITRQVKTARQAAKNRAAGSLMDELHMTPQEAKEFIRKMLAEQALKAKQAS
jgi:hypothetical protein